MAYDAVTNKPRVIHLRRYPCRNTVAEITLPCSNNVCSTLATGGDAVVTGRTHALNLTMVDPICGHRSPGNRTRIMTSRAIIARGNVEGAFTIGNDVIMAINARANDLTVIHRLSRQGEPGLWSWLMTTLAKVTAIDMRIPLTTGTHAVMAGDAATDHLGVINGTASQGRPRYRAGLVAGITLVAATDMCRRLSTGERTVVTAGAAAVNLSVIHRGRRQW